MNNRNLIAVLVVIIIVAGVFYKVGAGNKSPQQSQTTGDQPFVCTADAKQCSDGSYVSRSGPKCEFAPCPDPKPTGTTPAVVKPKPTVSAFSILTLRQSETGKAMNVTLRVLEILEDSRCPIDVTCVQAGTVRLRTSVTSPSGTSEIIFILNKPVVVGTEKVTLTTVTPENTSTSKISNAGYQFLFRVEKK